MAPVPAAMAAVAVEVGLGEVGVEVREVREAMFLLAAAGEVAAGAWVTHAGPRRWPIVHQGLTLVHLSAQL